MDIPYLKHPSAGAPQYPGPLRYSSTAIRTASASPWRRLAKWCGTSPRPPSAAIGERQHGSRAMNRE